MLEIENQVGMLGRLLPGVEETLEDGIPLAASGRLLADADRSIAVLRQFNVGPGSANGLNRSRGMHSVWTWWFFIGNPLGFLC
jgi:hypothetical protein